MAWGTRLAESSRVQSTGELPLGAGENRGKGRDGEGARAYGAERATQLCKGRKEQGVGDEGVSSVRVCESNGCVSVSVCTYKVCVCTRLRTPFPPHPGPPCYRARVSHAPSPSLPSRRYSSPASLSLYITYVPPSFIPRPTFPWHQDITIHFSYPRQILSVFDYQFSALIQHTQTQPHS